MREMEEEKITLNSITNKNNNDSTSIKKSSIFIYLLTSELLVLLTTVIVFSIAIPESNILFNISTIGSTTFYELRSWVYILLFPLPTLSLINSYLYIFKLHPKDRYKIYIPRITTIIAFVVLTSQFWDPVGVSYVDRNNIVWFFIFIIYCLISQIILKTYLLSSEKTTSEILFKKSESGSPSELEWRKFDTISGFLGIISGATLLQLFWLGYHTILLPILVKNKKRRLILENLVFHEDVNLTPIALELGLSLEEVIFHLKQLSLKRQINIDFTKYGAILKDIRRAKWFTPVVQEKHTDYLDKKNQTEAEKKANKFIEISERKKMLLADFRRVMGIGDRMSVRELILILPHKVLRSRTGILDKKKYVIFNRNQILMKKEKIIKVFVEERERIFSK